MPPESSHLLLAAVATTVLLGLGAIAGFYAGKQVAVVRGGAAPAVNSNYSAGYWSLLNDIDRCTTDGLLAAEQSKKLVSLGAKQAEPVAAELSAAMERIAATTRDLAKGLKELQTAARAEKFDRQGPIQLEPKIIKPRPTLRSARSGTSTALQPVGGSALEVCMPLPGIEESKLTSAEICEFTGTQGGAAVIDRRKQRHPYDCLQQLSPGYEPGSLPSPTEMVSVRCHDISVEGISFFWPQKPDFDMAVISLGDGHVLMSVEIRQSKAVFMHGEVQYLVGCRFLKRVDSHLALSRSEKCELATA